MRLPNIHRTVGFEGTYRLCEPVRPADFDAIHSRGCSQSEVEPQIVLRNKARLTQNRLRLDAPAAADADLGSDRAARRFRSHQMQANPVMAGVLVVAQQCGRLTHIHDENIDIAVIIDIAESSATAGMFFSYGGSAQIADIFETP